MFGQDMMGCQFLLSILAQSVTLLHRGQRASQLPSPHSHPEYYFIVVFCVILQAAVIIVR